MKSYETSDTDPVSRQAESNSFDKIFARKPEVYRILYITFLAVINAVIVGCIAKVLLLLINLITNVSFYGTFEIHETSPAHNALGLFVIAVPVIGGLIVGLIARYGSRAVRGHGIPEAMEKIITNESKIHPMITILKPLSAAISIGSGGPFGAEGPIISTGGALGSFCGQTLHITAQERKVLLAAGATAGMTAIFGTPFAAILLAIELLLFEFSSKSFLPVMMACITGACMHFVLFSTDPTFRMPDVGPVDSSAVLGYVIIGFIVGAASVIVTKAVYAIEDLFEELPIHWMWWPAIGGIAVGLVGYFAPRTLGVGYENITDALSGSLPIQVLISLFFWKFLSWAIALGSGTSGGTLAPLLTIGSALGCLLGHASNELYPSLHVSIPMAALVGMAALFAGSSRAILTSIIFAMETTMQERTLLPLIAGCSAAYLVSFIFMRSTIMTEKIKRRGIELPETYRPDLLALKKVADIITETTPLTFIDAHEKVIEVRQRLKDSFTTALIIRNDRKVIGVLPVVHLLSTLDETAPIASLVNEGIVSISPEKSLETALEIMLRKDKTALLVVESHSQEIVGLITEWDILKIFEKRFMEDKQIQQHISIRASAVRMINKVKSSN
jgi:H+/Cl- antiporter ClcA